MSETSKQLIHDLTDEEMYVLADEAKRRGISKLDLLDEYIVKYHLLDKPKHFCTYLNRFGKTEEFLEDLERYEFFRDMVADFENNSDMTDEDFEKYTSAKKLMEKARQVLDAYLDAADYDKGLENAIQDVIDWDSNLIGVFDW